MFRLKRKLIYVILIVVLYFSNSISGNKSPIKCHLYSECIVDLTEIEQINYRSTQTIINSSDLNVFSFTLPKIAEFRENGSETYKIKIIPVFIGYAKIEVYSSSSGQKRILTEVIIERPNPVLNLVFDVYLWVYCGIMSFCMGALIESELVHTFVYGTMNKQVGLAIFCKILVMPLVILFTFIDISILLKELKSYTILILFL